MVFGTLLKRGGPDWGKMAGGAVTFAVLAAAPALGFGQFAPGLLQAPAAQEAAVPGTLLAFDAPATTVLRSRVADREEAAEGAEDSTLVTDWTFTASRSRPNPIFLGFIIIERQLLKIERQLLLIQLQLHHHHHHSHHH
jgi:hypothetical protein